MNIFSLPIVEIAISIIISWSLFAIFCSMIQEAIVQIKSERGRFFKDQLLRQLYDKPNEINWASLLYTHSTVDLLSRAYNKPASDISPKIFAEGIIETVANAHIVQSKKVQAAETDSKQNTGTQQTLLKDFSFAMKTLLPSDVISLLNSALTKAEIKSGTTITHTEYGKEYSNVETVYKLLTDEIGDWYSQLCNRTSLWYQKKTKKRLFYLGLVISILLNVDSIQLYKYFRDNSSARSEMIKFYNDNETSLRELAAKYDSTISAANLSEVKKDADQLRHKADSLITTNNIPVGIQYLKAVPLNWQSILFKIIGVIISAFAASVGAPYWFDILRKVSPKK